MRKLMVSAALLALGAVAGLQAHAWGPGPVQVGEGSTVGVPVAVHAAIVTHVHDATDNGIAGCVGLVNLTVFPDGGIPVPRRSIYVFEDFKTAKAYFDGVPQRHVMLPPLVAYWPTADRCACGALTRLSVVEMDPAATNTS